MARRIRGILFDLGDTLLDFGQVDAPKLFRAGARLAYDYLRRLGVALPPFWRYHRRQLRAVRWHYFISHLSGREFNSMDLITRFSQRFGHELTPEQLIELAWRWYRPLSRQADVEEGVREMLADFRRAGLVLGVVSNTFVPPQVLDRHLANEGLLEQLPVRVYSCDVGCRKPNRRIFRLALRRAGLNAADTMFVGDSPRADVYGSSRVGMISVLKDPSDRHNSGRYRPDHRVRSLSELARIVAEYEGTS